MPAELPWWQRIPFGTTAWRLSMGRRQVVESVNAALKGTFADLSRGFFRVFGQTKMTILLGFTVAGYNLDRIRIATGPRSAPRRTAEAAAQPKRRRGTWHDIVEPTRHRATGERPAHIARPNPRPSRLPTAAGFNASRNGVRDGTSARIATDGPRRGRRNALNSMSERQTQPQAATEELFRDHTTPSIFMNIPWWRWRESNPRPSMPQRAFSERSR